MPTPLYCPKEDIFLPLLSHYLKIPDLFL